MGLTSGTRLGPYEILAPLGAGGMGEVYRALDTRLDCAVAIKILPGYLSENLEARQRFEREARTISSSAKVNHFHAGECQISTSKNSRMRLATLGSLFQVAPVD